MSYHEETIIAPKPQDNLSLAYDAASLLGEMLLEYTRRDTTQPLQEWLSAALVAHAGWERLTAEEWVRNVVEYVGDSHHLYSDLGHHRGQRKSRGSWIARQVEIIAQDTGAMPADVARLQGVLTGEANELTKTGASAWNDISRIALAKSIETASIEAGARAALEEDARKLAGDAAQGLLQAHPEASRLAHSFIEGRLEEEAVLGLQATLATATGIAASRGLLGQEFESTMKSGDVIPAWFAHHTFVGTENARLLSLAGSGVLDPSETIDRMADVVTAAATRTTKEICKKVGGQIGGLAMSKIPYVGPFLIPFGRRAGEFVGAVVGEIAGSAIGKVIKKGAEIVKAVAQKVVSSVKAVAKGAFNVLTLGIFS